jgi:SAM-dependent methyltransferase
LDEDIKTERGVSILSNKEDIREFIRNNYSEVAQKGSAGGCCGGGCSCSSPQVNIKDAAIKIGYSENDLNDVPMEANMGLGCGNPIAIADLKEGEVVLDLGSGGGFDSFLARKQVGEMGFVIGVDMTPEMIKLARKNAEESGYKNIEFRLGEIEYLPVADEAVDVIISNCVINLSLDKQQVFNEAYRVLKPRGRISISDVVATAEIPEHIKNDLTNVSGCIAGAEYVDNIENMLKNAGFVSIRMFPKDNSKEIIKSWVPDKNVEEFVASYIIEAEKGKSN